MIVAAIIVVAVIIIVAALFYNKKQNECSQQVYAMNPILFNQWYCLQDKITDAQTKLDDAENKITIYQTKLQTITDANSISKLQAAIVCQQNYVTYLNKMLDLYYNTSAQVIREQITNECGGIARYFKPNANTPANNGGVPPNCKTVMMPGVTAADLSPNIECSITQ